MNKSKFTDILLDADGTIFDFLGAEHDAIILTAKEFGFTPSDKEVDTYSSINLSLWKELEKNLITKKELTVLRFIKWFELLGVNADPVLFDKRYQANLTLQGRVYPDTLDFLKKLSEYCNIYIVTNGLSNCQRGRMQNSPVKDYINGMYISDDIGYEKPDVRFFDFVFNDLDIKNKGQILIIGDSITSDMQGGKNAGITTCLYSRNKTINPNSLCDFIITDYNQLFDIIF